MPVWADEDATLVFRALESPDYGRRTTKYEYSKVTAISEDKPTDYSVGKWRGAGGGTNVSVWRALIQHIVGQGLNSAVGLAQAREEDSSVCIPGSLAPTEVAALRGYIEQLTLLPADDGQRRVAASRQIAQHTLWLGGTEARRPQREAVGALGGVESLCQLLRSAPPACAVPEQLQHFATLGQLCLCPKNSACAIRAGALEVAKAIL
eukprot:COSAG01_NODE_9474_length_2436_cov_20.451006_1_plen_206_part_10